MANSCGRISFLSCDCNSYYFSHCTFRFCVAHRIDMIIPPQLQKNNKNVRNCNRRFRIHEVNRIYRPVSASGNVEGLTCSRCVMKVYSLPRIHFRFHSSLFHPPELLILQIYQANRGYTSGPRILEASRQLVLQYQSDTKLLA